jgi:UDP-glucuronate 4-epimerase
MSDHATLVAGAAGFIGFHVARQLLAEGCSVVGLDSRFSFALADLADRHATHELFAKHRFPAVMHLAAQAGVRHSIDQAHAYVDANLEGFVNILEGCRHRECRHLVYASSSSVYGANVSCRFRSMTGPVIHYKV